MALDARLSAYTEQNSTEQNRTEQNSTEQHRIEQNRTESNRTEQNRTEQNRTEPNRTEQNRTEALSQAPALALPPAPWPSDGVVLNLVLLRPRICVREGQTDRQDHLPYRGRQTDRVTNVLPYQRQTDRVLPYTGRRRAAASPVTRPVTYATCGGGGFRGAGGVRSSALLWPLLCGQPRRETCRARRRPLRGSQGPR